MNEVISKAKLGKEATQSFFPSTELKNNLLLRMADILVENTDDILKANELDLQIGKEKGTSSALLDRIALSPTRIEAMAEGLRQMSKLPDPIGEVTEVIERPNGLHIEKRRVPLGVLGIIYEARPNVTVDAAGLCLKTGNGVVLRGGSAAIHSNGKIVSLLHRAMHELEFPVNFLQLVKDTDRASVLHLLTCKEYIDVVIPRGGRTLIQHVVQYATVPVIETGEGICHIYIDKEADLEKATSIVVNAKCQRPSVCNAIETVLIDQSFAKNFLEDIAATLKDKGVEVRGCQRSQHIVPWLEQATEEDWNTEYLDLILSVKIVDHIDEAIHHITKFGTGHSESIITENKERATQFINQVDAAAVYHNASTRFTDGSEFGFGAEIGISTQKLHARGPMGLRELTSNKYCIYGTGQIRE
jgi:glutamate-5-semialdehyde dehydrogenase